ncbi:L-lactate permease [Methylopila sp. Yamaguchi]|uniref:L-lactate permease n=1 Tax=Methylopila sp. Yamaguchi TaxID=1437817 RepID=UPI000CACFD5C|nr:L-lactate permease [Methylopila sp. Yamaguchi]GBD48550.1 L-lactate permease [Methylopila sp. Yamaguchi]
MWSQVYDPFGNAVISTIVAAIPIVVLLAGIGVFHMKAHTAALAGLAAALLIAVFAHGMPADKAGMTALYGAAYGLLPIGWIILNIIFLYQLTNEKGYFKILQDSIAGITDDRRLQLLLIAFSFGAFFEGAAGFGTPVAVTGAILIGLGFSPLAASGLSLIANTAPVAFGALGTPVIALAAVTGLPLLDLSAMIGRQLPFFSILVPFWLIAAFAGFRGMAQIWPAILIAGVTFAIPQYLVSNYHGPWLVDVVAAIASILALTLFLRVWKPRQIWTSADGAAPALAGGGGSIGRAGGGGGAHVAPTHPRGDVVKAWIPWLILSVVVFCWGIPQVKAFLDGISILKFPVAHVDQLIQRVPPVVPAPKPEAAVYNLNWLSATGSGIFLSSIIAGFVMGFSPLAMLKTYWKTLVLVRFSLLTIAAMLSLGFVTRYSGVDATLGLAFAQTGWLYPFFGTFLGWLGVALTGSDTSSNVLFGSLQKISAEQLGLSPTLMAAANSSGGVMGKMIDAQSIVVASTATRWYGHEGDILRYVFLHSLALASLMGLLIMAQAYLPPFTHMVIGAP